jgi:hypothetical protein
MEKIKLNQLNVTQISQKDAKNINAGDLVGRMIGWVVGFMGVAYTPKEHWQYGYGPRY